MPQPFLYSRFISRFFEVISYVSTLSPCYRELSGDRPHLLCYAGVVEKMDETSHKLTPSPSSPKPNPHNARPVAPTRQGLFRSSAEGGGRKRAERQTGAGAARLALLCGQAERRASETEKERAAPRQSQSCGLRHSYRIASLSR